MERFCKEFLYFKKSKKFVLIFKTVKKGIFPYFFTVLTLVDYAKKKKISHSNLINKANRQTIEAFLEKGVWKIGVKK
ncbi:hypothetical protein A2272_03880 [Candidatus Peregrinibacteria bacterium RIFOXYA12_FULL_33_12]|nr:MAG: hypothetical protein A2263_01585 [Candidatus Peregrinibacteria bacterium RIFOXYA2_FULL_33_21]OGJ45722.1 MAG: hypothetical protein A2272_03880 [Candidatus Peregrinibacteria bacterium RIFOXYA12_FULL_33_12]OGJ51399.1 MAG: hypothetical protein A2307_02520 [Candidatus Peregrinibacteria bacterium RIFOXYB2_FULL_33_20]